MIFEGEYARARLLKREKLLAADRNPYPVRYDKTHAAQGVREAYPANEGTVVRAAGRVVLLRLMGKASFATIRDFTGDIQIYFKLDTLGPESYERVKQLLDLGDHIGVSGKVFRTKMGEISVAAESWDILSKSILPPPEKWHGLTDIEARYRNRHVDLFVNPAVRNQFKMRSRMISSMRAFYVSEGFWEVETPMMASRAGGAAARPFETHHNALDIDLFLRVAPELYLKRLLVGGFEKVFEIGRNFRNEGVSTRHNPEFTMLESYEAYADASMVMDFVERLLRRVAQDTTGAPPAIRQGDRTIDLTPPFRRLRYLDALTSAVGEPVTAGSSRTQLESCVRRKAIPADLSAYECPADLMDLMFEHLIEPTLIDPTFVTHYPRVMSPLAKSCAGEPDLADRFELFICGREIANAYSEQNDPVEQLARFRDQAGGDDGKVDWDYVEALAYGMPPAGGLGIGIDRLMMLMGDLPSIRDAILFPLLKPARD